MKRKLILFVWFIYFLSFTPGMVWARSKPISYRTGTDASEPYLHKDIQLLSHYIRIHLVSLDEINYEIQYEVRVEKDFVENPFLYASARVDEKFIQVNGNNLITVPYNRESLKEEDWKEIERIYGKDFLNYPVKYALSYLPVTLEQGDHRITVCYKAQTNARFDSPWNRYAAFYSYEPVRDIPPASGEWVVDILLEDTKNKWVFKDKVIEGNIRKTWKNEELPVTIVCSTKEPTFWWARLIDSFTISNLFFISVILLTLPHMWCMVRYRKKNDTEKVPGVVWKGALLVVFLHFIVFPLTLATLYNIFAVNDHFEIDEWILFLLGIGCILGIIIYLPLAAIMDRIFRRIFMKKE